MRIGTFLPQIGPAANPKTILEAAKRAEALGYDSVWVTERLLYPLEPQTRYLGTPDGSLPEAYKRVFDPLETLTFVAAHTTRIAVGTSVLDIPYYNPVMLARRLTTLDVFSEGRLRVGLGLGWSKDEYDAVGATPRQRGRRADEFLRVLKAIWTTDPVEFHGEFYQVPKSIIQPKPVQKPHPPLLLAAYTERGLRRAATLANGWHPAGIPMEALRQQTATLKRFAEAAGRDPTAVEVVVRGNLSITPKPLGQGRWMFSGTFEEIAEDIRAVRDIGVNELILDPTFSSDSQTAEGFLASLERLRRLV
ncbi:MAG: LLM class F420-dependent oxidoreductase [Chloroflexi bacterium]|nr:LLM class F420-dependent oxidoreductase [Chloroflexota bacterium]